MSGRQRKDLGYVLPLRTCPLQAVISNKTEFGVIRMPTVLSCPKCAAPLDLPSGANLNLRCPYCGCSILMSGELGGVVSAGDPLGASVGQAVAMSEIQKLVASKQKLEAIKL